MSDAADPIAETGGSPRRRGSSASAADKKYEVASMQIPAFQGGGSSNESGRRVAARCNNNELTAARPRGNTNNEAKDDVPEDRFSSSLNGYFARGNSGGSSKQRNNGNGNNHSSWNHGDQADQFHQEHGDDDDDAMSHDSSSISSSVGMQSGYIQTLIEKQKQRGDWSSNIEAGIHQGPRNADLLKESFSSKTEVEPTDDEVSVAHMEIDDTSMPGDGKIERGSSAGSNGSPSTRRDSSAESDLFDTDANSKKDHKEIILPSSIGKMTSRLTKKSAIKRALSSCSLVEMLRIQPICEQTELHDDIKKYNLAETVVQQANSVMSGDNLSDVTGDGPLDLSDEINAGEGNVSNKGTTHFLPFVDATPEISEKNSNSTNKSSNNILDRSRTPCESQGEDSDTFYLQSITSAENITHMSSAPDYDYYSISSSEDESKDIKTGAKGNKQRVGAARDKATRKPDSDETLQKSNHATTKLAAASAKPRQQQKQQKAQHQIRESPSAEKLSKEVCQVLGVPNTDFLDVAVHHRGGKIMSRGTELRLRRMARKESKEGKQLTMQQSDKGKNGENSNKTPLPSSMSKDGTNNKHSTDLKTTKKKPPMDRRPSKDYVIQDRPDSSDEESSDSSSSIGLVGHGGTKKKDDDKWESIRLARQSSREALGRRSSGKSGAGSSTATANDSQSSNNFRTSDQMGKAENSNSNHQSRNDNGPSGFREEKGNKRTTDGQHNALQTTVFRKKAATHSQPPRTIRSSSSSRRVQARRSQQSQSSDDDDNLSVVSSSSMAVAFKSRIGSMYRRLSNRDENGTGFSGSNRTSGSSASRYESDDDSSSDDEDDGGAIWDRNILSEGEYYLAMSMLVYIYALLRETSMLGHTDIAFDEIDVNSFQSDPGFGGKSNSSISINRRNKFLSKTKSAGFIIRVVMDELEKEGAFSSVEKNEGDMSVLKEFKQWVNDSRRKHLDAATEKTIKELRRKVARRRWKRAINAVRLMVRLGHSDSNNFALQLNKNNNNNRIKTNNAAPALRNSVTTSVLGKAPQLPRTLSGSMTWMNQQRTHIMNSLGISSYTDVENAHLSQEQSSSNDDQLVGESEIKEIINDALEEPRFFIEGSLLSNLIESGIEVVWFGDRHPNDVVYSICVNRKYKRVSVVFRGTVNSHNWLMNLKFAMTEHPNPIGEDYPGREDEFGLHTGFSLYMTRQRKDDSLTKIEEIFSNIDSIGRELASDGQYDLSITGHSLGGALATILAFYAATSNVFKKVKTIRVFTYAAPRVGCQRFLHAFQHLEQIGKLRMARFTNTGDIVPLIPFHGLSHSYKHAAMHIRLLGVDRYAQYWLRQALDVSYPKNQGLLSQMWRGWLNSFVRNWNTLKGYKRNHTLSEYQKRIRFALEYRLVLAQAGFCQTKKRSRLKTLDEYYFIKGASNVTCTGELRRIALEDRAKESVLRQARKLILVIALIALLEAVVLVSVLTNDVVCDNYHPLLQYPLYLLIGCRRREEESNECTAAEDGKGVPDFENFMTGYPQIASLSNDAKHNTPDLEDNSSTWIESVWMEWISQKTTSHSSSSDGRPPCIWGNCNFLSRPYLPWGVRNIHHYKSLPSTMNHSWYFESFSDESKQKLHDQEQQLVLDAMILYGKEDLHFEVSEMVLARSRGESTS